jgi:hypothetical protein
MDTALWRAYLACAISFYAIVGIDLVTASSQAEANLTALIGLTVAVINLSVFSGWTLYNRGVKA